MSLKKLLFLTTQLPYPPESGGVIKSFHLLQHFCLHYTVTLATLLKNDDKNYQSTLLTKVSLAEFIGEEIVSERNAVNYLKSVLARKTLNEYRNFSIEFAAKIEAQLITTDVVFIDHFEMFQYVPNNYSGKVVFHEHNAEWLLWERFSKIEANPIKSFLLGFESKRIRKKEIDFVNRSNITFASPNDKNELQKNGAELRKLKETYHLGNDNLLKLSDPNYSDLPNDIIFMGTLSWEANVDGLLYFLSEVFPLVLKADSKVKLNIVGRNPDPRIIVASEKYPENVILHGFVDNLKDVFRLGRVFILPLRFGSGMKVKCLDALYSGIPIVTTSIGAEGIELEQNKHALICDNTVDFSNALLTLLSSPEKWKAMSEASRALARDKYTWQAHLQETGNALNAIF